MIYLANFAVRADIKFIMLIVIVTIEYSGLLKRKLTVLTGERGEFLSSQKKKKKERGKRRGRRTYKWNASRSVKLLKLLSEWKLSRQAKIRRSSVSSYISLSLSL